MASEWVQEDVELLIPCALAAISYLERSKDANELAWGLVDGDDADLYYSSLAFAALACRATGNVGRIVDDDGSATDEIASQFVRALDGFTAQSLYDFDIANGDIVSLLGIIRLARSVGSVAGSLEPPSKTIFDHSTRLRKLARKAATEVCDRYQMAVYRDAPIREHAQILLALALYDEPEFENTRMSVIDRLEREQLPDGSWPLHRADQPDLMSSSLAVLSLSKHDSSRQSVAHGMAFLRGAVESTTWKSVVEGEADIFSAVVLARAMASASTADDRPLLRNAIVPIAMTQHEDGGFGAGAGFSTVELTAQTILALDEMVAFFETEIRRVDLRMRRPVLRIEPSLEPSVTNPDPPVRAELQAIESLMSALRQETQAMALRLEEQRVNTEAMFDILERESRFRRVEAAVGISGTRNARISALISGAGLLLAVLGTVALFVDVSSTFGVGWSIAMGAAAAVAFVGVLAGVYLRGNRTRSDINFVREGRSDSSRQLDQLIDTFVQLSESDQSVVRTLVDFLTLDARHLPADLFAEEAIYQAEQQSPAVSFALRRWLLMLAELDTEDRRLLLNVLVVR